MDIWELVLLVKLKLLLWLTLVNAEADGSVRLQDGRSQYEGRVEVYYDGKWGRVCDINWTLKNSNVVCRQLGFGKARAGYINYSPRGTSEFWLSSVKCLGTENNITECGHRGWGNIPASCSIDNDKDDAGVWCEAPGDGLVRLVGGTNSSGRVEAQYGGRWGRVCSAGWYLKDATVVCRQLGFTRAIGTTTQYVSKGTGEFLLADVNCGGGEDFLHNCSGFVVGLVPPGCAEDGSFGDAHVVCQTVQDGQLRLVDGNGVNSGRVEAWYGGRWGRVCEENWDFNDAQVVCRQLGFQGVEAFKKGWQPGTLGHFWLRSVQCSGDESNLNDCKRASLGTDSSFCNAESDVDDAGVVCQGVLDHPSDAIVPRSPSPNPVLTVVLNTTRHGLPQETLSCFKCSGTPECAKSQSLESNPHAICEPKQVCQTKLSTVNGQTSHTRSCVQYSSCNSINRQDCKSNASGVNCSICCATDNCNSEPINIPQLRQIVSSVGSIKYSPLNTLFVLTLLIGVL